MTATELEKRGSYDEATTFFKGIYAKMVIIFGTLGTVILATFMRGDVMTVYVHSKKLLLEQFGTSDDVTHQPVSTDSNSSQEFTEGLNSYLAPYKLQYLYWHILFAMAVPLVSYSAFTGSIMWYYDINKKHLAQEWKCQPTKFNTRAQLIKGMKISCFNMGISGLLSGTIACYIINGGRCRLYYSISDHGWLYLVFSTVTTFFVLEGLSYYFHRMYHLPIFYKSIHKWHHQFPYPAAVQATAFHPIEFSTYQSFLAFTPFVVNLYAGSFILILLWQYYFGVIDHTGINFESIWPWQPPVLFHDHHHKYFHCNYGFNIKFYDWLHDTVHKEKRTYSEEIYHPERQKVKDS